VSWKLEDSFALLENLNDSEDINRDCKNITENIQILTKETLGLYEWKQHKLWFDEEHLGFSDQRKQAKQQWLQDPNKRNIHNVSNVRQEASRQFSNIKWEYLKAKINERKTNGENKNIKIFV
jgi:hypothetical protein